MASAARVFGHVGSARPGDLFASRRELSAYGLHRPTRAGISGSQHEGADSIVLSEVYEDDVFTDEEIVYTGHGGRDTKSGHQVAAQIATDRNLALLKSQETGRPVRVLRRVPAEDGGPDVFRYEGLYRVVGSVYEPGKSGVPVYKFRLVPWPGL